MRVRKVNLGNGVFRLVVEPMLSCERNVPTHAIDKMVEDVIRREKGCCVPTPHVCEAPKPWWERECRQPIRPIPHCVPNREPDGIDVHVDRPLRENFWSHRDWCDAMAKYRTLEHVAKDCDWECREPMKGTHPNYNFHHVEQPKHHVCCEPTPFGVYTFDDDEDIICW